MAAFVLKCFRLLSGAMAVDSLKSQQLSQRIFLSGSPICQKICLWCNPLHTTNVRSHYRLVAVFRQSGAAEQQHKHRHFCQSRIQLNRVSKMHEKENQLAWLI
jgi:hypothetical protein